MVKAFKARCPKPLLVGSHRLSARYMGGQVEVSKLLVLESKKPFEVRGENVKC